MPAPLPAALSAAVALAGPTGSGKTGLSLRLAAKFGGEIVSCDSVQVFRFFNLGSAKLAPDKRQGIPHHLIDVADPNDLFTAGDFARLGREALRDIARRSHLPLVVGGTGFYLRALVEGLAPGPRRDESLRSRLKAREERRPGSLHRLLRRFDPVVAERIHPNDQPKVMRAVEICLAARVPASEIFSAGRDVLRGFRVLKIGLFPDRERLYQRLEARMEEMFAGGLIEETASILARGYPASAKPFESIGYRQALQAIQGELSPRDALFYAKRETRRYAKRQATWFRQEPGLEPVAGFGDDPEVAQKVEARIERFLGAG